MSVLSERIRSLRRAGFSTDAISSICEVTPTEVVASDLDPSITVIPTGGGPVQFAQIEGMGNLAPSANHEIAAGTTELAWGGAGPNNAPDTFEVLNDYNIVDGPPATLRIKRPGVYGVTFSLGGLDTVQARIATSSLGENDWSLGNRFAFNYPAFGDTNPIAINLPLMLVLVDELPFDVWVEYDQANGALRPGQVSSGELYAIRYGDSM